MKAIKMFGLAALAALLAMAFVGATSAIAESTALCSADEAACAEGNVITHVHEVSVGKAKLLTSLGTTECNVLFLGDDVSAVADVGASLAISGNFTYSNCELAGSECKATEENGPVELEILKEGHETASVTGKGLIHLECGKTINCAYTGTGLKGTAKGPLLSAQEPDNGEVSLSGQETTKEAGSGFICPKTAKLDITTSPLTATYVSAPGFDYCVKFEHVESGFYLGEENGECINKDAERKGQYELVNSTQALALGLMVCVRRAANVGLYKNYKIGSNLMECENDIPAGEPRNGRYELGTVL